MRKSRLMNVVIFASGSGSNAVKIIEHFATNSHIQVTSIFCNKEGAGIIEKGKSLGIPVRVFNREEFKSGVVLTELKDSKTDYIALAGFLWLIPSEIVQEYNNRIFNIHPALLPKYGGKGMHGMNVHIAVVENQEKESGITIHLVNEKYDDGAILYQESVPVTPEDKPEDVAARVLTVEHKNFARVIEEYILKTQ